jgi:glycosyltransferase involved in cell wall biosynthesis
MAKASIDVVIRFKNEEFWLRKLKQKFKSLSGPEIHLYGIDNNSIDKSALVFAQFDNPRLKSVNYLNINEYTPGASLDLGITEGNSDFILFLSAHCIPKNDNHIDQLLSSIQNESAECAGVYGRQLPLPCTGAQNTVDLTLTYPNEDRILRRTPLFNNANSIIKRSVYKQYPFDRTVTNLEDLIWAKKLQDKGYFFKYTRSAEVYHYHGIHQHKLNTSSKRLSNSLKVLLETGWLSIDRPEFCDYRTLSCIFEHKRANKRYLGCFSGGQYTFSPLDREKIDLNDIDYSIFTSSDLDESAFVSALQQVADQTSQVSLIGSDNISHNIQDSINIKEIKDMIEEDREDLLVVSHAILNQM